MLVGPSGTGKSAAWRTLLKALERVEKKAAEFYVMERVKGIILRAELPPELNLDEQQTRSLCKSFIDKFVELMREVGLVEVARTGIVAISRGKEPA